MNVFTTEELERLAQEAEILDSTSWKREFAGDWIGGVLADFGVYDGKFGEQRYYTLANAAAVQDGEKLEGSRFRVWETAKLKFCFEIVRPVIGDTIVIRYEGKIKLSSGQEAKNFAVSVYDGKTGKQKVIAQTPAPKGDQDLFPPIKEEVELPYPEDDDEEVPASL